MPAKGKKGKSVALDRIRLVAAPEGADGFSIHRMIRFDPSQCTVRDIDGQSDEKTLPWSKIMLLVPIKEKSKFDLPIYALSFETNAAGLQSATTVYYPAKFRTAVKEMYTVMYASEASVKMILARVDFPEFDGETGVPAAITGEMAADANGKLAKIVQDAIRAQLDSSGGSVSPAAAAAGGGVKTPTGAAAAAAAAATAPGGKTESKRSLTPTGGASASATAGGSQVRGKRKDVASPSPSNAAALAAATATAPAATSASGAQKRVKSETTLKVPTAAAAAAARRVSSPVPPSTPTTSTPAAAATGALPPMPVLPARPPTASVLAADALFAPFTAADVNRVLPPLPPLVSLGVGGAAAPSYGASNEADAHLLGYSSSLGLWHAWDSKKVLTTKNLIVAPYVVHW